METNDNSANSSQGSVLASETNTSFKTEIPEWPIDPTFLSLREDCTEDKANYNTDGIYYTDYIRGFLADLSHDKKIQNALSIFQFVPKNYLPNDPNAENPKEITTDSSKATVIWNEPLDPYIKTILDKQGKIIIRIDSGTFVYNGKLCDAYRRCGDANTRFCFSQDSIVGLFAGNELNDFNPNSDDDRERLEKIISKYNQEHQKTNDDNNDVEIDNIEVNGKRRTYIHYTCPVSLFEEHVFPIYVHGHVIACLMLGQMARKKFKRERMFFKYRDNILKHKSGDPIDLDTIEISSCTENEWEEKARTIVARIETFEERLEEKINHRNNRYIHREFEKIEEQFRKDVKNINIKKQDAVSLFTEALSQALASIREKFDNSKDGFIRMFALPIGIKHDELVPIGWSGAEFNTNSDFKFELNFLKGIDNENLSRKEQEDIILEAASEKIKKAFNREEGDLFLPGWLIGSKVAYIVWKRHDKELKKKDQIFGTYKEALLNFYTVALEYYSYIRGAKMELLLETTIQESAHESAHFILPAIDVVESHLGAIPKDMVSPKYNERYDMYIDSYEKYKNEVLESLHQLREINNGSSLILSPNLQIHKRSVQVFELLYKLKKTLNNRALDSHKSIYYTQSENYVLANIDEKYLNHALYNLLDNAIKYGYEGSYIRINMHVDRMEKMLLIEIVSYGIEIEHDDRIYQLFTRSEKAEKIAGGTGLGLYIVKKICEAHNGAITHNSEKMSDYNIPVLFNYKYRNSLANKYSLGQINNFEKELSRFSGAIENEVVYDPRFVSYGRVFTTRINEATYRNTFRITIPLN